MLNFPMRLWACVRAQKHVSVLFNEWVTPEPVTPPASRSRHLGCVLAVLTQTPPFLASFFTATQYSKENCVGSKVSRDITAHKSWRKQSLLTGQSAPRPVSCSEPEQTPREHVTASRCSEGEGFAEKGYRKQEEGWGRPGTDGAPPRAKTSAL